MLQRTRGRMHINMGEWPSEYPADFISLSAPLWRIDVQRVSVILWKFEVSWKTRGKTETGASQWLLLRGAQTINVTKATVGINMHSGRDGRRSVTPQTHWRDKTCSTQGSQSDSAILWPEITLHCSHDTYRLGWRGGGKHVAVMSFRITEVCHGYKSGGWLGYSKGTRM